MFRTKQKKYKLYYEIGFSVLLVLNALLLTYVIFRLNHIENLAKSTQAEAQEIKQVIEQTDL